MNHKDTAKTIKRLEKYIKERPFVTFSKEKISYSGQEKKWLDSRHILSSCSLKCSIKKIER